MKTASVQPWLCAALVALFGWAGYAPVRAQTPGPEGVIIDTRTGAPLRGATVLFLDTTGRLLTTPSITDAQGRFVLPTDHPAGMALEVEMLGYSTSRLMAIEAAALGWRIALVPDPLELEQVVVTAAGRAQRAADVAVPMVRVTREEIRARAAPSADVLLSEVPGLQTSPGTPVGSNIMIRGIGDARVLVLVDGQPTGGALLENRDLGRMSLAAVERVEVVKGPLSSRYGSDALGGVINMITREPSGESTGEARLLGGDGGRLEAEATVGGGGRVRYRATGSWRQEERVSGVSLSDDVFARVWDARLTARYSPAETVRLRSDVVFVRERQRWPVGGGFSGFNDNRGLTGWSELSWDQGPGTWQVRAFAQDYTHLYRSARGDAPIAGSEEQQDEQLWKAALAYVVSTGGHHIDAGLEIARRSITSPDKLLADRASDDQLEIFAQDAWQFGRATLTGGGRLTLNDRWGDTWSPSLGIVLLPNRALRLRGSVGRGFRAPSFKELAWDFANVSAGYVVQGHADLAPETSWSTSLGLDWAPVAGWSLSMDLYTNHIDNLIEFAFTGTNAGGLMVYSPRNVARARTRGLELASDWRFGGYRLIADYAYLDALSLDNDLPLDRRARHSGRVRMGADWNALGGLSADVTGHFTGAASLVGTDAEGLMSVLGERARLLAWNVQLGLSVPFDTRAVLGVDNLFDTQPPGWDAPLGRRIRIGLEATLF